MSDEPIEQVIPRCPHFGTCGGCQYQDIAYDEQLKLKRETLRKHLEAAGILWQKEITVHAAESYEYRNRIRLRIERVDGNLRAGYNRRATTEFLPITICPISAPLLWNAAEALLATAQEDRDTAQWLEATAEVELFCNHDQSKLQMTLFCAPRTKLPQASFERLFAVVQARLPQLAGAGAMAFDTRTGPTGRTLAEAGQPGLAYRVGDETYWISRGGFFQVNRFLIETLIDLVCTKRSGAVAWDLFAGVGLFSRVLARSYARVVAVEANPIAASDLRAALGKLSATHAAICSPTLEFLTGSLVQRERPELIVLDPPRAGAGLEACELLLTIAALEIVYVSCDPTTLARDLAVLTRGYDITAMHLLDLFPQTFHLETVVQLRAKR